jgi:hypothetical protein
MTMSAHIYIYEDRLFADSYVLQSASQHGWAVSHLGFGDFALNNDDHVLRFTRIDGSLTDSTLRGQGWEPHGRIHLVTSVAGPLDMNPEDVDQLRDALADWEVGG